MPSEVIVALISAFAVIVAALIGLYAQGLSTKRTAQKAVTNTQPVANGFATHVRTSLDQLCKDVGHLVARDEELSRRIENLERRSVA